MKQLVHLTGHNHSAYKQLILGSIAQEPIKTEYYRRMLESCDMVPNDGNFLFRVMPTYYEIDDFSAYLYYVPIKRVLTYVNYSCLSIRDGTLQLRFPVDDVVKYFRKCTLPVTDRRCSFDVTFGPTGMNYLNIPLTMDYFIYFYPRYSIDHFLCFMVMQLGYGKKLFNIVKDQGLDLDKYDFIDMTWNDLQKKKRSDLESIYQDNVIDVMSIYYNPNHLGLNSYGEKVKEFGCEELMKQFGYLMEEAEHYSKLKDPRNCVITEAYNHIYSQGDYIRDSGRNLYKLNYCGCYKMNHLGVLCKEKLEQQIKIDGLSGSTYSEKKISGNIRECTLFGVSRYVLGKDEDGFDSLLDFFFCYHDNYSTPIYTGDDGGIWVSSQEKIFNDIVDTCVSELYEKESKGEMLDDRVLNVVMGQNQILIGQGECDGLGSKEEENDNRENKIDYLSAKDFEDLMFEVEDIENLDTSLFHDDGVITAGTGFSINIFKNVNKTKITEKKFVNLMRAIRCMHLAIISDIIRKTLSVVINNKEIEAKLLDRYVDSNLLPPNEILYKYCPFLEVTARGVRVSDSISFLIKSVSLMIDNNIVGIYLRDKKLKIFGYLLRHELLVNALLTYKTKVSQVRRTTQEVLDRSSESVLRFIQRRDLSREPLSLEVLDKVEDGSGKKNVDSNPWQAASNDFDEEYLIGKSYELGKGYIDIDYSLDLAANQKKLESYKRDYLCKFKFKSVHGYNVFELSQASLRDNLLQIVVSQTNVTIDPNKSKKNFIGFDEKKFRSIFKIRCES